jgi:hypothetical protein
MTTVSENEIGLKFAIERLLGSKGEESVSFLQKELRSEGWRHLGSLADFESLCRRLGFLIEPVRKG